MIPRPEPACRWHARPRHENRKGLMARQGQAAVDTVTWKGLSTSEGHRVAQGVG